MEWLNESLAEKVRAVFEKRYKRKLEEYEVNQIARNLALMMESLCKSEWRMKYGARI